MILCGMLDLCRIIFWIAVDLIRPRAALEAEILVLRQQVIVLRRGRPGRLPFLTVDKFWLGFDNCFRRPSIHSPSSAPRPWSDGTVRAFDSSDVGSRGAAQVGWSFRP